MNTNPTYNTKYLTFPFRRKFARFVFGCDKLN